MPDTRSRVYWDADVFLSYVNKIPERILILDTLLSQSTDPQTQFRIVTSAYSMVEVAYGAQEQATSRLDPKTEQDIDDLWDPNTVIVVEFHPAIAIEARTLMRMAVTRGWKLRPGDAIHLASAKLSGAEEMHTYSTDLPRFSQDIGIPVAPPYLKDPQGRMPI